MKNGLLYTAILVCSSCMVETDPSLPSGCTGMWQPVQTYLTSTGISMPESTESISYSDTNRFFIEVNPNTIEKHDFGGSVEYGFEYRNGRIVYLNPIKALTISRTEMAYANDTLFITQDFYYDSVYIDGGGTRHNDEGKELRSSASTVFIRYTGEFPPPFWPCSYCHANNMSLLAL